MKIALMLLGLSFVALGIRAGEEYAAADAAALNLARRAEAQLKGGARPISAVDEGPKPPPTTKGPPRAEWAHLLEKSVWSWRGEDGWMAARFKGAGAAKVFVLGEAKEAKFAVEERGVRVSCGAASGLYVYDAASGHLKLEGAETPEGWAKELEPKKPAGEGIRRSLQAFIAEN